MPHCTKISNKVMYNSEQARVEGPRGLRLAGIIGLCGVSIGGIAVSVGRLWELKD